MTSHLPQPPESTPLNSMESLVICPNCVHQFRAIPVDIQERLADLERANARLRESLQAAEINVDQARKCFRDEQLVKEKAEQQLAEAREWITSVSHAIKTAPEFAAGTWGGDKEGWGYHFEVVRWMVREIAALRASLAERDARLSSIYQFGVDTLSGRIDGPDDRAWQRESVREMTKRARPSAAGKEPE